MPHIPRAFCADCAIEMVIDRTGVTIETVTTGIHNPAEPGKPQPYYKVSSDRLVCPECGHAVLVEMPRATVEHFQQSYKDIPAQIVCRFADDKGKRGASIGLLAEFAKFLHESRASVGYETMADARKPGYDGEYGETEVCLIQLPWDRKTIMAESFYEAVVAARKVPRPENRVDTPPLERLEGFTDI